MGSLDLNFGPINDVVFVVEDTSMGGSCMEELYQNYVVPSLEHFNGGTSKEIPWASVACSTTFSLVRFQSADCLPKYDFITIQVHLNDIANVFFCISKKFI